MARSLLVLLSLVLAGCAAAPPTYTASSACNGGGEGSYACQVERYEKSGM